MKKKAKKVKLASVTARVAGLVQGRLTGIYAGSGRAVCRCECGAQVVLDAQNFLRGLAAKDCGRVECRPVGTEYAKRLARHVKRSTAWQKLGGLALTASAQFEQCQCRRNKYYCKSCEALIDKFQAVVAAGEWVGFDSLLDREPEPEPMFSYRDFTPTVEDMVKSYEAGE